MGTVEQVAEIAENRSNLEQSARIVGHDINFMTRHGHLARVNNSTRLTLILLMFVVGFIGYIFLVAHHRWEYPEPAKSGSIYQKSELTRAEIKSLNIVNENNIK